MRLVIRIQTVINNLKKAGHIMLGVPYELKVNNLIDRNGLIQCSIPTLRKIMFF